MILYHGTDVEIDRIDLQMCMPFKDFGQGFYTTTVRKHAENMAFRRAYRNNTQPLVHAYSFDKTHLERGDLQVLLFPKPTEAWALFVMNNRIRNPDQHQIAHSNRDNRYDIVVGPIADDAMVARFREYALGRMDLKTMAKEMEFKEFTVQYTFHTEKAVSLLQKEETIWL